MIVEVWSPDVMEALGRGSLNEVVMAENEAAIGLFDVQKGCRVWLDEVDARFLREMLDKTEFGRVY